MNCYPLTVVTPDGCLFDGEAVRLVCRTVGGDVAILARHCDYCTALGMGEAHIVTPDGETRSAACIGGMLTVLGGRVRLIATTWEWKEQIDADRADKSRRRAETRLKQPGLDAREIQLAQARLHRALVRLSVAGTIPGR